MNTDDRYNPMTIWLHWITAILIFGAFIGGLLLEHVPKQYFVALITLHKLAGVLVLTLVAIRLLYRLIYRSPEYPAIFSKGYKIIIKLGHLALYGLMVAVPMLGWYVSNANGYPVSFFGIFDLPMLTAKLPKVLAHEWSERHEITAFTLIFLALGHIALAIYHERFKKDLSMERILPF